MQRLKTGRTTIALLATLTSFPGLAAAQAASPTSIGNSAGWASRFVPRDMWTRMLERPEGAPGGAFSLAASPDSVWTALTEVMKQFDLPAGFSDRPAGEIGTIKAKVYKRLGKYPLSDFLRCGEGMSGPNADTYVVYLSVAVVMKTAKSGETVVLPAIGGDAVDLPNGRNDVVPCTTSGQFEDKVTKAVRKRLGIK